MILRLLKSKYSPSINKYSDNDELVVTCRCMDENGKCHDIEIVGTEPRFWTRDNPDDIEMPKHVRSKIISSKRSGEDIDGVPLYEIRTEFPFYITKLRDYFPSTYQADVTYDVAFKLFYKIRNYIEIPDNYKRVHIGHVKPVDDKHSFDLLKTTWSFDIETGDVGGFPSAKYPTEPVLCWTLMNASSGVIIHATIGENIDKDDIKRRLRNSHELKDLCKSDKLVPPLTDNKIKIQTFESNKMIEKDRQEDLERQLFQYLFKCIRRLRPGIIYGHHIEFDMSYARERCKTRNSYYKGFPSFYKMFELISLFDSMNLYQKNITGEVTAMGKEGLGWIAEKELGYGKVKGTGIGFTNLMLSDPNLMSIYNIMDVVLPIRINSARNDMINFMGNYASYHGHYPYRWDGNMALVENEVMMKLNPDIILRTKNKYIQDEKNKIKGGHVMDAPSGLFKDMFEVDLGQEYPSIIRSGNIGFRTKVKNICSICEVPTCGGSKSLERWTDCGQFSPKYPVSKFPSGRCYRLDINDIMPETLTDLSEGRNRIKNEMKSLDDGDPRKKILDDQQTIRKYSMNSWYGILLNKHFRLYDKELGDDITSVARKHVKWNKDVIENLDVGTELFQSGMDGGHISFTVRYQDTDSCKCTINEQSVLNFDYDTIKRIGEYVSEQLQDTYDDFAKQVMGINEHCLTVKYEDGYAIYYQWGVKKRYAYKKFNGEIDYKGVDIVRSSSSELTKKVQKIFFDGLLNEIPQAEIRKSIETFINETMNGKHDLLIGRPIGYKSENSWVKKAVDYSNRYLGKDIKLDSKPVIWLVKYIHGKPTPPGCVALGWGDDVKDYNIVLDREEAVNKYIYQPLTKVIPGLGKKDINEWLIGKTKVSMRGEL